jgi:hypothetical protein
MENVIHSDTYMYWDGHAEPLMPRFMDDLALRFTYKYIYARHSMHVGSRYFRDFDNTYEEPQAKPKLDASIGFNSGNIDLSYRIENYLNVQNYDFNGSPAPGIAHYAVLKITF